MPAGCSDTRRGASLSFATAFLILCAWGAPISSSRAQPAPAPSGDQINGQRLAQRYCGQCHAVAQGASPLRAAGTESSLSVQAGASLLKRTGIRRGPKALPR